MKTLQELKNKKFEVEKTVFSMSTDEQIKQIKKRLQPESFCGQYEKTNDIHCLIINNKIVATCKNFYQYTLQEITKDNLADNFEYSNFTCIYVEKINRYLIRFTDFCMSFDLIEQKEIKEKGFLKVRSNGDYVFNNCYGEIIKKDDLIKDNNNNIIGFKKMTFKNEIIEYKFIKAV
jgi:hypothetical protein